MRGVFAFQTHCSFPGTLQKMPMGTIFTMFVTETGMESESNLNTSIESPASLKLLNLSYSNLSGTLAPDLGTLVSVEEIDLSHTGISGKHTLHLGRPTELTYTTSRSQST